MMYINKIAAVAVLSTALVFQGCGDETTTVGTTNNSTTTTTTADPTITPKDDGEETDPDADGEDMKYYLAEKDNVKITDVITEMKTFSDGCQDADDKGVERRLEGDTAAAAAAAADDADAADSDETAQATGCKKFKTMVAGIEAATGTDTVLEKDADDKEAYGIEAEFADLTVLKFSGTENEAAFKPIAEKWATLEVADFKPVAEDDGAETPGDDA